MPVLTSQLYKWNTSPRPPPHQAVKPHGDGVAVSDDGRSVTLTTPGVSNVISAAGASDFTVRIVCPRRAKSSGTVSVGFVASKNFQPSQSCPAACTITSAVKEDTTVRCKLDYHRLQVVFDVNGATEARGLGVAWPSILTPFETNHAVVMFTAESAAGVKVEFVREEAEPRRGFRLSRCLVPTLSAAECVSSFIFATDSDDE